MEDFLAIAIVLFLAWLAYKAAKYLWGKGIIQSALSAAASALISGFIVASITGDPAWGAGGGIAVTLFSLFGSSQS